MRTRVKDQIATGLRLGGALAVSIIALIPLVDGLRRVVWAAPSDRPPWSVPLGWLELIVAAALFVSTAHVLVQFLAGCMIFALVKGIVVLVRGAPTARFDSAEMLLVFSITLALLMNIMIRGVKMADRIALALYLIALGWGADAGLFTPSRSVIFGLAALCVSCGVYYWNNRGGHTSRRIAPDGSGT